MINLKVHCRQPRLIPFLEELKGTLCFALVEDFRDADIIFGGTEAGPAFEGQDSLFILTEPSFTVEQLRSFQLQPRGFGLLELNHSGDIIKTNLISILEETYRKRSIQRDKIQLIRENQNIHAQVEAERSKQDHFEEGRQSQSLALKKAAASLRKRIFFLKCLNEAVELNDVISMIQEEARKTKGLGDPILVLTKDHQTRIFYMSGRRVIEKKASLSVIGNVAEWRQILADHLNRPIGPLIHLEGVKSKLSLFFEHQLQSRDLKEIISEWQLRMVGIELMVDRFQLAHDLTEAALFWEKTFDGLGEPIGIFDGENKVIRVNQLFTKDLVGHLGEPVVRHGSQIFNVESYDIRMDREIAEGSKVVHLSDQSSYFQLKQHMIQTEKIAALGQLAGHIAHELNNPLTGIRSLCQVLSKDKKQSEEIIADITEVESAAVRCQNIIRNLLEYSKPHSEDLRVSTDVNEIVSNTLPLIKSLIGRHRSEISLSNEPLFALVDPHMLQQVVFNLVANACQAMVTTGTIVVKTTREGDVIKIRIQDTGPGVPENLQGEIFQPFFTTKPAGEGTGLGLSLSLNIIRGFGGDLILDKNYFDGAAFEIHLPEVSR